MGKSLHIFLCYSSLWACTYMFLPCYSHSGPHKYVIINLPIVLLLSWGWKLGTVCFLPLWGWWKVQCQHVTTRWCQEAAHSSLFDGQESKPETWNLGIGDGLGRWLLKLCSLSVKERALTSKEQQRWYISEADMRDGGAETDSTHLSAIF